MGLERRFTQSKNIRATVLFTTIWAVSAIVNSKEGYQLQGTVGLENGALQRSSNSEEPTHETGNSTLEIVEQRWLSFSSLLKTITNIARKVTVELVAKKHIYESQGNYTCYRNVCFNPENGLGLEVGGPVTPEIENTTFILFDGRNSSGEEVNEATWEEYFYSNFSGDISKPLLTIVHGLNGSRHSPWAVKLREALFENVNCNVLVVDWQPRAAIPHYAKAASSSILVGVLLSWMLQKIIATSNCSLHPDNVHLIGFSLGAHAAGVCGRHFYNTTNFWLGRITGLDPAGPLFEESNVSLSSNDATFVDVIHTNAGNLSDGRFGLNKSIGHVDFYPNGGSDQPKCALPIESTDPGCSHKRAQALFTESVYRNCSFKSYYCAGGWKDFESGLCNTTNSSLIGEMGFYSINKTGRGNQYLKTNDKPPFCIIQPQPQSPVVENDVKVE